MRLGGEQQRPIGAVRKSRTPHFALGTYRGCATRRNAATACERTTCWRNRAWTISRLRGASSENASAGAAMRAPSLPGCRLSVTPSRPHGHRP